MKQCFIILRHVNSPQTDVFWKQSYFRIRQYYTDPIYIIDDNSTYAVNDDPSGIVNLKVIHSEFPPQRGEVLPFYYLHRHKLADKAIILHDSAFLHAPIPNLDNITGYKPLFDFVHKWDQPEDQRNIMSNFENAARIMPFHSDTKRWKGMFGAMCVIEWDFLNKIEEKYKFLDVLTKQVDSRFHRMSVERIMGVLFHSVNKCITPPVYGDIHKYFGNCAFQQKFSQYIRKSNYLAIEKVWSGR